MCKKIYFDVRELNKNKNKNKHTTQTKPHCSKESGAPPSLSTWKGF